MYSALTTNDQEHYKNYERLSPELYTVYSALPSTDFFSYKTYPTSVLGHVYLYDVLKEAVKLIKRSVFCHQYSLI